MDARVALTIGWQRKKLPLESRTRYLSQGIIGNRSVVLQRTIYFCLPLKMFVKAQNAKQTNPKKWKFAEIL